MPDRVDLPDTVGDGADALGECRLDYTTDDPFAGIVRPLDHARRMGFELIALRARHEAGGFAVSLRLCGQPDHAIRTLARRITNDCTTRTPVGVTHGADGAD